MGLPDANHVLKTGAAALVSLLLAAASAWVVHYLYGLDLLSRMLHLFPIGSGLGVFGFILIPIVVVLMLVCGAFCVAFFLALLLFWVSLTVAFVVITVQLAVNLFADPAHRQDPLQLMRDRARGIASATAMAVMAKLRRFLP